MKKYESDIDLLLMQLSATVIPTHLYHYTNLQSLIGMVGRKELWFSNVEYLNDVTEFNEGKKLFLDRLSATAANFGNKNAFESLSSYIEERLIPFDYFSLSLSEERDSLDQWRAYSDSEDGVMVTFQNLFANCFSVGIYCVNVIYETDDYSREIDKLVKSMESWEFDATDPNLFWFWGKLSLALSIMFLRKKNIIYKNEREWKVFYLHRPIDDEFVSSKEPFISGIDFRRTSDHILPYSKIDVRKLPAFQPHNFVSEVVVSPVNKTRNDPDSRTTNGIKRLLKVNGIERWNEIVSFSKIPYR